MPNRVSGALLILIVLSLAACGQDLRASSARAHARAAREKSSYLTRVETQLIDIDKEIAKLRFAARPGPVPAVRAQLVEVSDDLRQARATLDEMKAADGPAWLCLRPSMDQALAHLHGALRMLKETAAAS